MSKAQSALGEMNREGDGSKGKRLSVERIYQRKTQLEHILLRPDTYIGSIEEVTRPMWVFDGDSEDGGGGFVQRQISFVPGLYKIFDEILVNAADNKQRDPFMRKIEVTIDPENNLIQVWNDGRGIPIEMHKTERMYVPSLIFGELLTSSNYDDSEKKVTGGRNGYGAKLCNIFSKKFTLETASKESGKKFKQIWHNNMSSGSDPQITSFSGKDFTCVSFQPDLERFGMDKLDKDIVSLMARRAYDLAGSIRGVRIVLNKKQIPIRTFQDYVGLYLKAAKNPQSDEEDAGRRKPDQVVHAIVNDRWEVCVTPSSNGFQQVSFVNSIATTKGGTHVTCVANQLVEKLAAAAKKKNKGGMEFKAHLVKTHLWIFVNCLIENPTFDSQTKENMTTKPAKFGAKSQCLLPEDFIKKVVKCGVVDLIVDWAKLKSQAKLQRTAGPVTKQTKLKGVPKLDDANNAGGKNSQSCTLILTEGDSAKTLAVSGLSVVGRDMYGVFPLRGKVLNVREATHKQIAENAEINNIVKIIGLKYGKKYTSVGDLKSLRYGRMMIMTDQDQDGSHIKGLLINFIHHNWPTLLRLPFLEQFITPIVKVSKARDEISFYSLPEFQQWKEETADNKSWKVKYYKGLGTSTPKEAKEYFQDMERHRIPFSYSGHADDAAIELAFSRDQVDGRKQWLTDWLSHRKERREMGLNESLLYDQQTSKLTFSDFVNKELIQFSNADNERSIPSLVDGLKPGQRKVLFTCFKRNDKKEVKVAQLAGSVAEVSAYHHGETSLMTTIIHLAHNYIGSNNVNLLQPIGQFGTRLHGGKDAASPRYVFTKLSPLTRFLMPQSDDLLLNYIYEDNLRIEPDWYCPIIPMVLVNGSDGIGTGYSSSVPNYDVREIVANLKRMLAGESPQEMMPSYKGFTGQIVQTEPQKFMTFGTVAQIGETELEITELPIKTWTQAYKEKVLEPMLHGTDKIVPFISDYNEYHTDTTVRFVVKMSREQMAVCEKEGFHKKFKLESSLSTSNLVLFDRNGCLKKYENAQEILKEFYGVRFERYVLRKKYLEGKLEAEAEKLSNQARFIVEKCKGEIVVENKKKKEIIDVLRRRGFASDPVKVWKEKQDSLSANGGGDSDTSRDEEDEEEDQASDGPKAPDYSYLWGMPMLSLSTEKKDELLKARDAKIAELAELKKKTPSGMWKEELDHFVEELEKVEQEEKEDLFLSGSGKGQKKSSKAKGRGPKTGSARSIVKESFPVAEPDQVIAPRIAAAKKIRKKAVESKVAEEEDSQKQIQDYFGVAGGDEEATKKQLLAPKASKKKAPAAKKPVFDISDDDGDESGKSKKKRGRRPPLGSKPAAKKKKSDEEDDWPLAVKSQPSAKKADSEEEVSTEDEDVFEVFKEKPKGPMRQRKQRFPGKVAVDFSSDESDDDDDYSDDEADRPKKKGGRPPLAAKQPEKKPILKKKKVESENDSDDDWPLKKAADTQPVKKPITSKKLSDEDEEDVLEVPKGKPKGPAKQKKQKLPGKVAVDEIDEDHDDISFVATVKKVGKAKGKEPAKKPAPKKKTADVKKAPVSRPQKKTTPFDLSDDDDNDAGTQKKPKGVKKLAAKKKQPTLDALMMKGATSKAKGKAAAIKPSTVEAKDDTSISLFSDDSDSFAPVGKAKVAPKRGGAVKRKVGFLDDDDSDEDGSPLAVKSVKGPKEKAAKKKKTHVLSDDDDDIQELSLADRIRRGKKAPINYGSPDEESGDDLDQSFDPMEELDF